MYYMDSPENIKKLEQRITTLESKIKDQVPSKNKPPRKPSEYNKFMASYFSKHKDPKKSHKDLFAEAAKAWNTSKK